MFLQTNNITLEVLDTGDIRSISYQDICINQLFPNHIDTMAANIYLRIKEKGSYIVHPLLGKESNGQFAVLENSKQLVYKGQASGISYTVVYTLAEDKWFIDVKLHPTFAESAKTIDLIYGQDIGLASKGHIQGNEAYNSQYIDHKVFETEQGYIVCSRQNQWQASGQTGFPMLQQGSFQQVRSFSTDGYPFYGLSYKIDGQLKELHSETLNNRVYQYEFAYTSLQTLETSLDEPAYFTFYGIVNPSIETAITSPIPMDVIRENYTSPNWESLDMAAAFQNVSTVIPCISSLSFTDEEINSMYNIKRHIESKDGKLLSFFGENHEHVVLMEKELQVERPHGHIMLSGTSDFIHEDLLATTTYIYGVFSSQTVVGNTSFNKLTTNCRNALNVSKVSGQRIMIKRNGIYTLLTMAGIYELGYNYTKWFYKFEDDVIELISYTNHKSPTLTLELHSKNNKSYDIAVFCELCNGPGPYDAPFQYEFKDQTVTIRHDANTLSGSSYPGLHFNITADQAFDLHNDAFFYQNLQTRKEPYLVWEFRQVQQVTMTTTGFIQAEEVEVLPTTFEHEKNTFLDWINIATNGFSVELNKNTEFSEEVDQMNDLVFWYSHNARVHFLSPHGLEQFGGAAWGTRDVCQGPFEYFLSFQNYPVLKNMLLTIYRHQYEENGNWPQWFMFDRYYTIQHHESHGDIIVWPLKALSDYIKATGDFTILKEELEYTHITGYEFTKHTEPLAKHVRKQIDYILQNFIPNTHLSCYGDGDWDDTLQPSNPALRKSMVSGWTVTLTYQVFREFGELMLSHDPELSKELTQISSEIKKDYHHYIIKNGVTSGFIHFDGDDIKYLLHPEDKTTGLNYRLLPMTRSCISEMFDLSEANTHYSLIKEHLYHPDGVRLMNRTCTYRGGVNTYFKRAETAANFGREIGLQYVHAHIRFIESMAKLGKVDETWDNLLKVLPINIKNHVPNASYRQSNCYFSSSDGEFDNRYEAMADFDKLKSGSIPVKAGWRIYSSGPGILLNQLISNVLGLRIEQDDVIIDPVLPDKLNGLTFQYEILHKPVKIIYEIQNNGPIQAIYINDQLIPYTTVENPYRPGGAKFKTSLVTKDCVIRILK
ncbi:MAG: cellobiose phosphorylase [Herbinix sp.]|nr:cellobiose phosphorylase [Herbinix sp.]